MAFYDSGITYNSGALYDEVTAPPPRNRMSKVKLDLRTKTEQLINALRR